MQKLILTACLLLATTAMNAQKTAKDGGISSDMIQQMEGRQPASAADRALANAIAQNKIDDLAKNYRNGATMTTTFSVETPAQSIHDQQSSGRCWMFSGLNVLRANFAKAHADTDATDALHGAVVEYSQAYLFFYDQLEKANLMLQGTIDNARKPMDDTRVQFFFKNPLNDGGTFCGVADLTEKYGLVPMSVMPETYNSDNTSRMSKLIASKLREYGLELRRMVASGKTAAQLRARKTEMLGTVYHMLAMTLGEPVKTFTYTFRDKDGKALLTKTYTPKSFYDATVYHKTYEVAYDRHTYDGHNWKYLNLPMEEIAQLAIASLKDGHKLYSSYDVGKQLDRKSGFCDTDNYDYATLFGTTFPMDKADRIATFDSGSTHAMTLTAVDLDAKGQPLKWKVENSWGATYGYKGCLIMTNRWFNEYMFRLVVNKKYASSQLLAEFDQKPTEVMPEDPLFGTDD